MKKAAKLREEITREADRQYRICTRLLVKGLRKRAIQLVQGLPHDDPYAIYQRCVSEFDGQGRATKLSLYHKANTIRLAPGESVYILVSKLDDIFRKLSDLKERLSEDYKIGALLNALPNKPVFQTFKSAILTSDKDDWTYAQVCERLALCGEQEHRDQLQVPSDGAFASLPGGGPGGKRPSRSKQRKKPLGACPNCRKEGHWAKFCPAPCGLCSGSNHERRRCPRFARNKAHPSSSTPRSSSNSRVQEPSFKATTSWLVADSTFAVPQSDSSISYLDSGTSRHMVGEAVPLTDITPRVSSVRTAGKELLHLDKSATGHIDIVNETVRTLLLDSLTALSILTLATPTYSLFLNWTVSDTRHSWLINKSKSILLTLKSMLTVKLMPADLSLAMDSTPWINLLWPTTLRLSSVLVLQ